jgi:hypothetical protein
MPPRLGRDRDEERPFAAQLRVEIAPDFELRDAVRTPAAAKKLDDQRSERQQDSVKSGA